MSDQSAFSRKKLETINIEKRDWMEELNLPPQLIKFVRANTRALQIGGVVLVLLFIAYNGGQYYFAQRLEKSTALLDRALKNEEQENKKTALAEVVSEYGSTDAGVWARIELAQLAFKDGNFDGAIGYYEGALDEADDDSSIAPLLEFGLANSYEQKNDYPAAAAHFNKLRLFKGFERHAWLGLGRISEKENHPIAALEAYEKVLAIDEKEALGDDNEWLAEKVRLLRVTDAAPAPQQETASEEK